MHGKRKGESIPGIGVQNPVKKEHDKYCGTRKRERLACRKPRNKRANSLTLSFKENMFLSYVQLDDMRYFYNMHHWAGHLDVVHDQICIYQRVILAERLSFWRQEASIKAGRPLKGILQWPKRKGPQSKNTCDL